MKNSLIYCLISMFTLISCMEEKAEHPTQGLVKFSSIDLREFNQYAANSRIQASSEWKHVFQDEVILTITNKEKEYTLSINPNDFSTGYEIMLPMGEYTFKSRASAPNYTAYLPFSLSGEFVLDKTSLDISLEGNTNYGLITLDPAYVESAQLSKTHELEMTEDGQFYYLYVKNGLLVQLSIYEFFASQEFVKYFKMEAKNHYHYKLNLTENQGTGNIMELLLAPFTYGETPIELPGGN
ncbi:hypothetical protein FKX85_16005 [Echinicola soli]|uniref:DUF4493 domain-containing protein n=1 Tax=Echinicola soli TaxID=2591634 RepID=A0A514CKX7_9BACT|nr:hypothetical protein [Echinicola soli]QDH80462.1 hypothetical protein FKX85_16005 [Echinicola soli]